MLGKLNTHTHTPLLCEWLLFFYTWFLNLVMKFYLQALNFTWILLRSFSPSLAILSSLILPLAKWLAPFYKVLSTKVRLAIHVFWFSIAWSFHYNISAYFTFYFCLEWLPINKKEFCQNILINAWLYVNY